MRSGRPGRAGRGAIFGVWGCGRGRTRESSGGTAHLVGDARGHWRATRGRVGARARALGALKRGAAGSEGAEKTRHDCLCLRPTALRGHNFAAVRPFFRHSFCVNILVLQHFSYFRIAQSNLRFRLLFFRNL